MLIDDPALLESLNNMQNGLENGLQGILSLNLAVQIPLTASLQYLWDMINA